MLAWMSSLQSSVVLGPSGPVVVLTGEADAQSAGQLREVLVSQVWRGGRRLVVDVSQLRYVDSESVRVLVVAAKMLREQNGELVLWRPQAAVAKLLDLMDADRVITVEEPSDEMLGAEAGAPAAKRHLTRGFHVALVISGIAGSGALVLKDRGAGGGGQQQVLGSGTVRRR